MCTSIRPDAVLIDSSDFLIRKFRVLEGRQGILLCRQISSLNTGVIRCNHNRHVIAQIDRYEML